MITNKLVPSVTETKCADRQKKGKINGRRDIPQPSLRQTVGIDGPLIRGLSGAGVRW